MLKQSVHFHAILAQCYIMGIAGDTIVSLKHIMQSGEHHTLVTQTSPSLN